MKRKKQRIYLYARARASDAEKSNNVQKAKLWMNIE